MVAGGHGISLRDSETRKKELVLPLLNGKPFVPAFETAQTLRIVPATAKFPGIVIVFMHHVCSVLFWWRQDGAIALKGSAKGASPYPRNSRWRAGAYR